MKAKAGIILQLNADFQSMDLTFIIGIHKQTLKNESTKLVNVNLLYQSLEKVP